MQSVSSILSGEFHEGVLSVCSETQGQEGATQLQKYLLHGRGAVILQVISTIGVSVSGFIFFLISYQVRLHTYDIARHRCHSTEELSDTGRWSVVSYKLSTPS